jgi:hypothetical protein
VAFPLISFALVVSADITYLITLVLDAARPVQTVLPQMRVKLVLMDSGSVLIPV